MNKPKLTLCMIVRNEEKFLRQCLESAKPFVDEIVIVDTGSTDSTIDIAREFADTLQYYAWIDDFAAARNYALSHCTGDWVLVLDADETLTPENGQKIRDAIAVADSDRGGINCTLELKQVALDGKMVDSESQSVRLFRNGLDFKYERAVHEQVLPSILKARYLYAASDIRIQHHGYAVSLEVQKQKSLRNLAILDLMLAANPYDYESKYHRANSLTYLGRFEEAEAECLGVVEYKDYLPQDIVKPVLKLYEELHRYNEQMKVYNAQAQHQQALVDFALNYARYKLGRCTNWLPQPERDAMTPFLMYLDAVVASDAAEAMALLKSCAVRVEPQFLFECVDGGWNASLAQEPEQHQQHEAKPVAVAGVDDVISRLQQKRSAA